MSPAEGSSSTHSALDNEAIRLGAVVLEAPSGYESDDVIAGVVSTLTACCDPPPNIVIVSADKDMQQLLARNVAWLQPLPCATRQLPCPFELHTADTFLATFHFPAASFSNYLSLVGKADSSVGGTGISDRTARKLLGRYGTIDGICQAAQRGELRAGNFPKGVCCMFQDVGPAAQAPAEEQLQREGAEKLDKALRNLRVLAMRPEALQLPPLELLQPLLDQASRGPPQVAPTPQHVALKYPAHCFHLETCQAYIRRLLQAAAALQLRAVSPHLTAAGHLVDLLLQDTPSTDGRLVAVVVLGPADFKVAEEQAELPPAEVCRQLAAQGARKHLLQIPKAMLVGSTVARLQLLRQEAGLQLRVAPFYEVPEDPAECSEYLQQLFSLDASAPLSGK